MRCRQMKMPCPAAGPPSSFHQILTFRCFRNQCMPHPWPHAWFLKIDHYYLVALESGAAGKLNVQALSFESYAN